MPSNDPSWAMIADFAENSFKTFVPDGTNGKERILFPVPLACHCQSASPFGEGFPTSIKPLVGHGFIFGWYLAMFTALETNNVERVTMLFECARTATQVLLFFGHGLSNRGLRLLSPFFGGPDSVRVGLLHEPYQGRSCARRDITRGGGYRRLGSFWLAATQPRMIRVRSRAGRSRRTSRLGFSSQFELHRLCRTRGGRGRVQTQVTICLFVGCSPGKLALESLKASETARSIMGLTVDNFITFVMKLDRYTEGKAGLHQRRRRRRDEADKVEY